MLFSGDMEIYRSFRPGLIAHDCLRAVCAAFSSGGARPTPPPDEVWEKLPGYGMRPRGYDPLQPLPGVPASADCRPHTGWSRDSRHSVRM